MTSLDSCPVSEGTASAAGPTPHVPAPVVSTQWLADHLGAENLVVLDASVLQVERPGGGYGFVSGHDAYLIEGHVPGAGFADLLGAFSDPAGSYGFPRPDVDRFEAAAAEVGIDNDTAVVVYDSSIGHWASRIWWLFRTFGYDDVAVLDGGITKWRAEERPLEHGWEPPREGREFHAHPREGLWASQEDVRAVVRGDAPGVLICGVPRREFIGEKGQRPRLGHIPGSYSLPPGKLIDRDTNGLRGEGDLRREFAPALESSDRVIVYCSGGVASAEDALGLTLIGHENIALYDGSLNEWAADPENPLTTLV